MSSSKMGGWIVAGLGVAAFVLAELVHNAYTAGLREGREQACARLAHDQEASTCAQLIEKDVVLDDRTNKAMGRD